MLAKATDQAGTWEGSAEVVDVPSSSPIGDCEGALVLAYRVASVLLIALIAMATVGAHPAAAQMAVPAPWPASYVSRVPGACSATEQRPPDIPFSGTWSRSTVMRTACIAVIGRWPREPLNNPQEAAAAKDWVRNAKVGALVGGAIGAIGGLVLLYQSDAIASPAAVALWGGVVGGAVGALIGIVWTASR